MSGVGNFQQLTPLGFSDKEVRARLEETGEWDGDGALRIGDGPSAKFLSVPEAMERFDVSPMLRRFGTWAVTEYGVECLTSSYAIEVDRLDEPDWLPHVGHKVWVVYEDFRDALYFAKRYFKAPRVQPVLEIPPVPRAQRAEPPTTPGSERRPRKARHQVSTRIRFLVLKRDGYTCQLCGRTAAQGVQLDVDHKLARKNGGTDDMNNLWVLCSPCNNGKGTHDL